MTAHTQGEARVCALVIADGDCVVMVGERQILECYEDGEVQDAEDRANAQRVVKTWNAYQQLVEAARFALNAAEKDWAEVLNSVGGLSDAAYERASKEPVFTARKAKVNELRTLLRDLGETS